MRMLVRNGMTTDEDVVGRVDMTTMADEGIVCERATSFAVSPDGTRIYFRRDGTQVDGRYLNILGRSPGHVDDVRQASGEAPYGRSRRLRAALGKAAGDDPPFLRYVPLQRVVSTAALYAGRRSDGGRAVSAFFEETPPPEVADSRRPGRG